MADNLDGAQKMALKYPQWQEPLAAAILEFNPQQLPKGRGSNFQKN